MYFIDDLQRDYEKYGLPEEFVMCLPDRCEDCGAPMEISEVLTGLRCSNPKCKSKLVMRIRAICKDLNILSFGESTIEKFIDYYDATNPLDIFELQEGMLIGEGISLDVSTKIIKQIKEKDKFLLWEFVQVANIPFVRTSARKIFQGYRNLTEAFKDIEEGGVGFIGNKLGVSKDSDNEVSVQATKVYTSLMTYKDELLEGERNVTIIDVSDIPELNVVCSDQVGGRFRNKPEFYAFVRKEFDGLVHVNFLTSVSKNIDVLVWAGADGSPARYTSKVQKVERYNEKGSDIDIMTGEQFVAELKSQLGL